MNNEVMEKNRGQNFKFGDKGMMEKESVTKSTYDYKGNPMLIRQTLNEAQKSDLRAAHFQYGSHENDYKVGSSKVRNSFIYKSLEWWSRPILEVRVKIFVEEQRVEDLWRELASEHIFEGRLFDN